MKHPYRLDCDCSRCSKERARRDNQSKQNIAVRGIHAALIRSERNHRRRTSECKPAFGSAEWAETRGDDLGESPDY